MEGLPFLGIAFPTYNRAQFLERSLASVVAETAPLGDAVSVLVCDNASADETPAVVAEARRRFPALHSVRHVTNLGGVANILRCIELTEAEWIWVLPDDCLLEPGRLAGLLSRLKGKRSPVAYARCALWPENELDRVEAISADLLTGANGQVWQHLSWLPCLLLHRASILRHLPEAHRLGMHSYPHLVLALLAVRELKGQGAIPVVSHVFSVQAGSGAMKRYSWIHGAIWRFAQTMHGCWPGGIARGILRQTARAERLGQQVLAHMPAEFSILPPRTPWSLVRLYGASLIPALLAFLWLRYLPRWFNQGLLAVACTCTARGPFATFHSSCQKLAARLKAAPGYTTDF